MATRKKPAAKPAEAPAPEREPELANPQAAPTAAESKAAELAGKEASVPPSDPRESVTDHAPGKTADDVVEAREAHERGENQDAPAEDEREKPHYFIVDEEVSLIEVAAKLGLPNHTEIGVINGMANGHYGVQRGQRVLLPAGYTFVDVDQVEVG